jgi:DNA-binding NtrC family response regulator
MANILVCEDEPLTRQCVMDFLSPKGFTVFPVSDGAEALQIMEENSIDIVISDINMKPMDGITLLEKLRAADNSVPFVLMTGHPQIESYLHGKYKLGAFEYIQKPFDFKLLLSIIEKLL